MIPTTSRELGSTLTNILQPYDHATAIIIPGKEPLTISFKELVCEALSFQTKLASLGITPGAPVSIVLPNSYEFVISFLATTYQRAIACPLNPAYKREEFDFYISDLNSALILIPQGSYEKGIDAVRVAQKHNLAIAECYWNTKEMCLDVKEMGRLEGLGNQTLQRTLPYDVALILHTSGTTSRPKAVPITHQNLVKSMKNIQATYELSEAHRSILVMPLFHVHGLLAGLLAPLYAGGSVLIPPRFSAREFWSDFITYRVNWYTAVPTIHEILLKNPSPNPMPEIKFIRSCSSPLNPITLLALEKAYGAPVLEAYAMTEATHQISSNPKPPASRRPGSVGIGHGVVIKILNEKGDEVPTNTEGEICIKGKNVISSYLNNPVPNETYFTKDGFFRTGDEGKLDENGYLYITGRIKELINKGGEKISPNEVDNVLMRHPKIGEAVSFAIPDPLYGQDIAVAIVAKSKQHLTVKEIQDWVGENLAKYKVPREVHITDRVPKTATGKIQRRLVSEEMHKQQKMMAKL